MGGAMPRVRVRPPRAPAEPAPPAERAVPAAETMPPAELEALADKTGNFRHWVCKFALQYVQQKHGVAVDYKYNLPKMKYKGDLSGGKKPTKQFIRKVGPTIEEVG